MKESEPWVSGEGLWEQGVSVTDPHTARATGTKKEIHTKSQRHLGGGVQGRRKQTQAVSSGRRLEPSGTGALEGACAEKKERVYQRR